jgi:hypothetical protein
VLAVDILVAELSFLIGSMKTVFGDMLTTLGAARKPIAMRSAYLETQVHADR